jgi:hypothetical protein
MADPRYNPTSNRMVRNDTDNPGTLQVRLRFTAAQVNAGATVVPAVPGYAYRLLDAELIAIGGAAAGATDVRLLGTRAAGSVALLVVAVAALTQSALVRAGAANATLLADGTSHTPLDANTPITIGKTGGSLTGATSVDVILSYALE